MFHTISATSHRSFLSIRHTAKYIVLSMLAISFLTGCRADNTPQEYGAIAEKNFMDGCLESIKSEDNNSDGSVTSQDSCACMYKVFYENVPMSSKDEKERDGGQKFAEYDGDTFIEINKKLKSNPNSMPEYLKDKLRSCSSAA